MSIRKVTSTLSDARYIRALEAELKEHRVFRLNVLPRLEAVEKRPRAAGNRALIPRAPIRLSCSGTVGGITATFQPVTMSTTGEPIEIALHELAGAPSPSSEWTAALDFYEPSLSTNGLAVSDDGQVIALSFVAALPSGGYFRVSRDGGLTFASPSPGPPASSAMAMSADGSRLIVGGFSGVRISSDFGQTWSAPLVTYWSPSVAISRDGATMTYSPASSSNPAKISRDGGSTWSTMPKHVSSTIFGNGDHIILTHDDSSMTTSVDNGHAWSTMSGIPISAPEGRGAGTADGGTIIWGSNGSAAMISHDAGATWMPFQGPGGLRLVGLEISGDGTVIFANLVNGQGAADLHSSRDGGLTWASEGLGFAEGTRTSMTGETTINAVWPHIYLKHIAAGGPASNERHLGYSDGTTGSITTPTLEPGDWTFRVRAISTGGATGAFSEPFALTL